MPTWVNTLTPWPYAHDWDNSIESKEKKWHEDQFSINEMLKDEMEKKSILENDLKKDQSQPMLTFKTRDPGH